MQQWREIKSRHRDALVLFRVGDFYEMFYEDAEEGSRLLDLTLTSRNNGSSRAPLAGVPAHSLDTYLQRLVRLGRRVAICEQVEDPAEAKGVVRREVTETVSPGTALHDSLLDARRNNYLVAIAGHEGDAVLGAAWADLSTGELRTRVCTPDEIPDLIGRLDPSELLLPRSQQLFEPADEGGIRTYRPDWLFDPQQGREEIHRRFGVQTLEGYGFGSGDDPLVAACGALVGYLSETQPAACESLRPPRIVRGGGEMRLDEMTRRNLELVEPLSGARDGETLLRVLDLTLTPMGARMLRGWVLGPLLDLDAIGSRLDAVSELKADVDTRRRVRAALGDIRDLERLAVKIASGRCSPRDLLAVRSSLLHVPRLAAELEDSEAALLRGAVELLDPLPELSELIEAAISEDAPPSVAEGGVIRPGYDADLDESRELRDGAVDWIARLQASERERTGIGSLKVGFNKVFGYYLEVTRANLDRVPEDYHRKQTLANAERYVTPELKEWEEKVVGAEERILRREAELFQAVRERAAESVPRLQGVTEVIARVDVLCALAEVAERNAYVRPDVHDGFELEITAGRHPVVETMMPREEFIPNDVTLDPCARVMILTGPNMAGKSTVLRQVGLITLLAQMGSFVPAAKARVPVVDRIFTRVGASDNLVRGQSTFMVEMTETAAILHGATPRSLVLLDEIGRGTSTWDGLSVATAVTEFLHDRIGAKTIFATHYHELTQLADRLPAVVNFSVAVKEAGERIVFLRSLVPGGADRSYGVEVARLAGLPPDVIRRARSILHELEGPKLKYGNGMPAQTSAGREQLPLFDPPPHPALERLRALDPNSMTPLQALVMLMELVSLAD